tara:strand:+ start:120 stop:341 length:222 start_codon:yes stop_codon:yes gene_type:complete
VLWYYTCPTGICSRTLVSRRGGTPEAGACVGGKTLTERFADEKTARWFGRARFGTRRPPDDNGITRVTPIGTQ